MNTLTKLSIDFLKSLESSIDKMQYGPSDYPTNWYSSDPNNVSGLGASSVVQQSGKEKEDEVPNQVLQMLSNVSPALKLGLGINQIREGIKEAKAAKLYNKISEDESNKRVERLNREGYGLTPYATTREWTMKDGGKIPIPIPFGTPYFQLGGISTLEYPSNEKVLDNFMNKYNQNLAQQNQQSNFLENYYLSNYINKKNKATELKNQGISTIQESLNEIKDAAVSAAKMSTGVPPMKSGGKIQYMQEGDISEYTESIQKGDTKQYTDDMYSEDYVPVQFRNNSEELINAKLEELEAFEEHEQNKKYEDYIFEEIFKSQNDEYEEYIQNLNELPTNTNISSNTSINNTDSNVIDQIKYNESRRNYSITNSIGATGAYQFLPSWAPKIKQFANLDPSLTKQQVMEIFRKNSKLQDEFMNHVIETEYNPWIQKHQSLLQQYDLTNNDIIRLIHYRGGSDLATRLKTNNWKVSDEEVEKYNNPQIEKYLGKQIIKR